MMGGREERGESRVLAWRRVFMGEGRRRCGARDWVRVVKVTKRSSGGAPERIELKRLSLGG